MSKFVNEETNHIFSDSALKPICAETEFVENQIATWSIRRQAEVMRRRTEFHDDVLPQDLFGQAAQVVPPQRFAFDGNSVESSSEGKLLL